MNKSHYIIPIFVPHEGCPHSCVFCNQNSITGSKAKVDSQFAKATVQQYLETIPKDNSIIEVSFFGGSFTAINIEKQSELLAVAKEYKDLGLINYIRLSTRPDYIDHHILSNLKFYGVDIIELGVQSLDKEVLQKSSRGHDEEDVIKASNLIKEYGITLGHQIMLGLPGDTFEKDIETAKKIIQMGPEICRIYPALVIKDTPMELLYNSGAYRPYTLEEGIDIAKIIYGMFKVNNINVIRIGLQPTDEIAEGKSIVAGPFHPAFRELVEGSLFNELIINEVPAEYSRELTIRVNSRDISKLYAYKKKFFIDMKKQLKTISVNVIQDDAIKRENIVLQMVEKTKKLSIYEYLLKKHKEGYCEFL